MRKSSTRKRRPARRGNSGGGRAGNGMGHNSKARQARKGIIREVYQHLSGWEAERRALGEKIRAEKQKRIKGDLGMTIKNFNMAVAFYNLEGDERDAAMATVHEVFSAFDAGEQLDFFKATERVAKAGTEHVDEAAEAAAVDRGPVSGSTENRPAG